MNELFALVEAVEKSLDQVEKEIENIEKVNKSFCKTMGDLDDRIVAILQKHKALKGLMAKQKEMLAKPLGEITHNLRIYFSFKIGENEFSISEYTQHGNDQTRLYCAEKKKYWYVEHTYDEPFFTELCRILINKIAGSTCLKDKACGLEKEIKKLSELAEDIRKMKPKFK